MESPFVKTETWTLTKLLYLKNKYKLRYCTLQNVQVFQGRICPSF
jgi:hypothetical protein